MRKLLPLLLLFAFVDANRFGEFRKAAGIVPPFLAPSAASSASELIKHDEELIEQEDAEEEGNTTVFDASAELVASRKLDMKLAMACHDKTQANCGPDTEQLIQLLRLCQKCMTPKSFDSQGGSVMCTERLPPGSKVEAFSYNHKVKDEWSVNVANEYKATVFEYVCADGSKPIGDTKDIPHPDKDGKVIIKKFCLGQEPSDAGYAVNVHVTDTDETSVLLKSDIQGTEWKVYASESVDSLRKFKTMVVEFHGLKHVDKHSLYVKALQKIDKAGFAVAHLHEKNGADTASLGTATISDTLQATFVKEQEDTALDCRVEAKVPFDENPATTSVQINIDIQVTVG